MWLRGTGLHSRRSFRGWRLHLYFVQMSKVATVLMGMAAISSMARSAHAEQFILFDATIDYTWDQAVNSKPSKSHFYVNEGNFLNKARPTNWLSPIDYRNGTLHVRTEVLEKPPGDQQVGWTLCYIPNSGGYGCADTTYYKATGVFDRDTKMTDWWQNGELNWDQGVKQMDLIYAVDDSGSGHVSNFPALKDLTTPTKVRITMVQVSAGSTYDPSIIPGVSGSMGGAGGAGGAGGQGGSAMLPMGGMAGASSGAGMGGLLGAAGSVSAGTNSGGSISSGGTSASSAGSASVPMASGGASSVAPTETTTEAGCSLASPGSSARGFAFTLALSALLLASRKRRVRG